MADLFDKSNAPLFDFTGHRVTFGDQRWDGYNPITLSEIAFPGSTQTPSIPRDLSLSTISTAPFSRSLTSFGELAATPNFDTFGRAISNLGELIGGPIGSITSVAGHVTRGLPTLTPREELGLMNFGPFNIGLLSDLMSAVPSNLFSPPSLQSVRPDISDPDVRGALSGNLMGSFEETGGIAGRGPQGTDPNDPSAVSGVQTARDIEASIDARAAQAAADAAESAGVAAAAAAAEAVSGIGGFGSPSGGLTTGLEGGVPGPAPGSGDRPGEGQGGGGGGGVAGVGTGVGVSADATGHHDASGQGPDF